MDNKFTRWDVKVHHPIERCDGTVATGQCPYNKINGTNFCPMHGYNSREGVVSEEISRNYRLRRWQKRVNEFADHDQVKSLREEIGILRMTLEEVLLKCEDATDLLMMSQRISDTIMKIEKLVVSCDKLENRMGLLLPKRAVIQLAAEYVQIISDYIEDTDIIEQISQKMLEATDTVQVIEET
jgi:uncharacterized Zn finger protein (UPF0148 family)